MTSHSKDSHGLAAAVACGAQESVTFNLKDSPPDALAPGSVESLRPNPAVDSREKNVQP